METRRLAIPALSAVLLPGVFLGGRLPAQSEPALGCDPSAIQWFIPGQFKQALQRAKEEKRLLVIKGISFGVDDAGAQCATKGKW